MWKKIKLFYEKALEAFQVLSPSDKPKLAKIYKSLGNAWSKIISKLLDCKEYNLKALNLFEESLPLDHPDIYTMYRTMEIMYMHDGPNIIERLYLKGLRLRENLKSPNCSGLHKFYVRLRDIYFYHGKFIEGVEVCMRALRLYERFLPNDDEKIAELYFSMGNNCKQTNYEYNKPKEE